MLCRFLKWQVKPWRAGEWCSWTVVNVQVEAGAVTSGTAELITHEDSYDHFQCAGVADCNMTTQQPTKKQVTLQASGCEKIQTLLISPGAKLQLGRAQLHSPLVIAECPHTVDIRVKSHLEYPSIIAWIGQIFQAFPRYFYINNLLIILVRKCWENIRYSWLE